MSALDVLPVGTGLAAVGAGDGPGLRVLIALPGLHRVARGAEVALESIGAGLAGLGFRVTLAGSGEARSDRPYEFVHVDCAERERFRKWPKVPPFRGAVVYEELSFARRLRRAYDPGEFDATLTCAYPFTNWVLRRGGGERRPVHLFVTQNGDWPARRQNAEYRYFGCDGLVCTNPEYFERHRALYPCVLIPNGVDTARFVPGRGDRAAMGIPEGARVVLFVSALAASKRVVEGIRAAAAVEDVFVLVAGDGELREEVERVGREALGARFRRARFRHGEMPGVYACADAVVHMSVDEPFGNVYIEGLACGKPVVAHGTASTRWILGEHGTLVNTEDAEATTRAISRALATDSDARRAARRAEAQRRFSWASVSGQYADAIRAAVARRKGARA